MLLFLCALFHLNKSLSFSGIIAANALVFCCWRVPALQRSMVKYFTSNPSSSESTHLFCFHNVLHLNNKSLSRSVLFTSPQNEEFCVGLKRSDYTWSDLHFYWFYWLLHTVWHVFRFLWYWKEFCPGFLYRFSNW